MYQYNRTEPSLKAVKNYTKTGGGPAATKFGVKLHFYFIYFWGKKKNANNNNYLSNDVASGSDITLCNKICKPLVVYRFTGNVMTSITTLRT